MSSSSAQSAPASVAPDPLSPAQVAQYKRDGFLLIEGVFDPGELRGVIDEITGKVDRLARQLHAAGRLKHLHEDAGFYQRLTRIEADCPGATVVLHVEGLLQPSLAALWSHPKLLDLAQQVLGGGDVAGHPVWNLRCKTPNNPLATVPWHQDTAYLAAGSETTFQPTAWIPFLDAGSREGTLQFIAGGGHHGVRRHRLQRNHGPKTSWYLEILPEDLPPGDIVTVPVPFGSVLMLDQLVPHRSTENLSDRIRWSVDLRWQRPDQPTGMDIVAPPVVMRRHGRPVDVDWSHYLNANRFDSLASGRVTDPAQAAGQINGPWINRWAQAST